MTTTGTIPPKLQFAFDLRITVTSGKIPEMGQTAKGLRKIIPILGGNFEGPNIKGTILPGGYDWQLVRADGVAEVEARYVLQTHDGALLTIINAGLRHGPAAVMARMANGEPVEPDQYYFRSAPVFETSAPQYAWLTTHLFIATGIRKPAEVIIQVWLVL